MRAENRCRGGRWAVGQWPLRWKIGVVLVVPIAVAISLGGLRMQERLDAASEFAVTSERIRLLPMLVALDGDAAIVMGTLAQRTLTPEFLGRLDSSIAALEQTKSTAALDSDAATNLARALAEASGLSARARFGPTATTAELTTQLAHIRTSLSTVVTAIADSSADPALAGETGRLEALWSAQKIISAEGLVVVGASDVLAGRSSGSLAAEAAELLAHLHTESAMLDQVFARYPPDDPTVDTLRKGVNDRTVMQQGITQPDTTARALDDLKYSLFASIRDYGQAVAAASAGLEDAIGTQAGALRATAWREGSVVSGMLLTAVALAAAVAQSVLASLRRLRNEAVRVAHQDLPEAVERIKSGTAVTDVIIRPLDAGTREEIGQLARAVDDIHSQAVLLAGEQAQLRRQMNDIFESLARRSRSLLDLQVQMIEELEFEERDPKRLENLFRLDHVATRMRRYGENLLILADDKVRRVRHTPPMRLEDAVQAAISQVEEYPRVRMVGPLPIALNGTAAADLVHILVELLDNALRFSSPDTNVGLDFGRTFDGGATIDIVDQGIGIGAEDLRETNSRLAHTPRADADTARRMGLFVVGKLAHRHGMTVNLRSTLDTSRNAGITATVSIPGHALTATEAHHPAPSKWEEPHPSTRVSIRNPEHHELPRRPTGRGAIVHDIGSGGGQGPIRRSPEEIRERLMRQQRAVAAALSHVQPAAGAYGDQTKEH
ncbi:ATP-binding protein [Nocardia sp. NPDC004860]|uniref:sensor histidine kinase n=1 Tax=Nocardia sp. NPDC004860 TaxID=3154557 RepID=UPI0033A92A66